ncbi:MAG: hypothetical protein GY816_13755 [Cytophagales bacterium]|nr:hypothetical protein [Cytophagales bacterium]
MDFTVDDPTKDARGALQWYRRLMKLGGSLDGSFCNGIGYSLFTGGLTLFAIPLTSDRIAKGLVHQTSVGNLSLLVDFEAGLDRNILVNIMGTYADSMELEPLSKLVSTSYTPGNFA